jgi:hypothetical protein
MSQPVTEDISQQVLEQKQRNAATVCLKNTFSDCGWMCFSEQIPLLVLVLVLVLVLHQKPIPGGGGSKESV